MSGHFHLLRTPVPFSSTSAVSVTVLKHGQKLRCTDPGSPTHLSGLEVLDRHGPLLCGLVPVGLLEEVLQADVFLNVITPGDVL